MFKFTMEHTKRATAIVLTIVCFGLAVFGPGEILVGVYANTLSGILLATTMYLFPSFWRSQYERIAWRFRRDSLKGRTVYRDQLKNGGIKLSDFGNWQVWSFGKDEVEPDLVYPESFTAGAQLLAKSTKSHSRIGKGALSGFKLSAQSYSEAPGKIFFFFTTNDPVVLISDDPSIDLIDDRPTVEIKFGDEKTRHFPVTIYPQSPNGWRLHEEDAKFIQSKLWKSSRMLVRWHQYVNDKTDTVTAEFDLEGWDDAFAEIKRRFDEHALNGWQDSIWARLIARFGK